MRRPASKERGDAARQGPNRREARGTATLTPSAGAARHGHSGDRMASVNTLTPTRDDFTALLNETYGADEAFEGSVVKGRIVAIEKDMALIDIGLKTEGRVALKEFTNHGREPAPGGRRHGRGLSRAHRERARRSRHLARQGAPRGELGQARTGVREGREGRRRHLQPGQGRLHRRPRRRRRLPAALPGRHPPGARRRRR